MGMTYVKSDEFTCGIGASNSIVIDLGLGIDEAARILGILGVVSISGDLKTAQALGRLTYSFDPEDTLPSGADDEHFFIMETATVGVGTAGGAKAAETVFADYSKMNLVTTRNLAMTGEAYVSAARMAGRVYYEKFKPSAMELNQLIATRR